MANVENISILEYRVKGTGKVVAAQFPTSELMHRFVNQHRRVVTPEGRVIRKGDWDYHMMSHKQVSHA